MIAWWKFRNYPIKTDDFNFYISGLKIWRYNVNFPETKVCHPLYSWYYNMYTKLLGVTYGILLYSYIYHKSCWQLYDCFYILKDFTKKINLFAYNRSFDLIISLKESVNRMFLKKSRLMSTLLSNGSEKHRECSKLKQCVVYPVKFTWYILATSMIQLGTLSPVDSLISRQQRSAIITEEGALLWHVLQSQM